MHAGSYFWDTFLYDYIADLSFDFDFIIIFYAVFCVITGNQFAA